MYKYGFIGTGNMGSSLARALDRQTNVAMSNRSPDKVKDLTDELGFKMSKNEDIAENSSYIMLGVKPQILPEVCEEIKEALKRNKAQNSKSPIIITMAAGIKMEKLCELLGEKYPVIRIMPNTPVAIGKGVILATKNNLVSDEDFEEFILDFKNAGSIKKIDENLIDAASVISGCGPAYIYMYMESLAKAGEKLGLSYDLAKDLAIETTIGSASLAAASSNTLEELRIKVCSKGGSTIEGVRSLEESQLEKNVEKALGCAYNRTIELSRG